MVIQNNKTSTQKALSTTTLKKRKAGRGERRRTKKYENSLDERVELKLTRSGEVRM
jgi:hypothetical protein